MRFLVLLLATLSFSAVAQVYKWTDENGNVHFGTQPPPGQQEEVHIRESKTGSMVTEKQKQMINRIDREREARHQERMAEARAERNQTNYACESAQSDLDYYQETRDDIGSAGYSAGDMRYVKDKIADARRRIQQNCR